MSMRQTDRQTCRRRLYFVPLLMTFLFKSSQFGGLELKAGLTVPKVWSGEEERKGALQTRP